MKLEKAIEILTYLAQRLAHISQADEQTAVKLGIEALKRVLNTRVEPKYSSVDPLPGETPGADSP